MSFVASSDINPDDPEVLGMVSSDPGAPGIANSPSAPEMARVEVSPQPNKSALRQLPESVRRVAMIVNRAYSAGKRTITAFD